METGDYEGLLKLLLIGDSSSGKSKLLSLYINDGSTGFSDIDIGEFDCRVKSVVVNNRKVKLQIWDTAGMGRFRSMTHSFYRGTHGVLFVYDAYNERTLDSLVYWDKQVSDNIKSDQIPKVLAGNCSVNSEKNREVLPDRAKAFSESHSMSYIEYNIDKRDQIVKVFDLVANKALNYYTGSSSALEHSISLNRANNSNTQERYCCTTN